MSIYDIRKWIPNTFLTHNIRSIRTQLRPGIHNAAV